MSIRSYTRSTDCHCESRSQNITTGVNVSVVSRPAFWTFPLSNAQRQFVNYKTAVSTSFTRRKPSVNFYQFSTIPLAFIFKLFDQFAPPSITNTTSKRTVFNHVSDSQVLNRNHLVFAYQLSSQLMQKIFSRIRYFSLDSSYSNSRFLPIFRAFLSSSKCLLRCSKFSIFVVEMLGIVDFIPVTGSYQASQSSVQTNIFSGWRQWLNRLVVNQKRNKPTSRRFEFDSNCRWVAFFRKISTPNNIQWLFAFSDPQLTILPFKRRASKFSISSASFLFEIGIFSTFCPKVGKCYLKMTQGLLQRNTANLVEKRKFFFFFPSSEQRRGLIVANPFLSLIPSLRSGSQSEVVNQPNTPHCSTQEILLFERWVKPIFVGAFGHLQHLIQQLSHFNIFNLKIMHQPEYLLTSGVLNPTQLAPFPLTAKTSRVLAALDTSRSSLAGVSTGGIR